ncbi:unnamed protein product [Chrysodeixis includens]|uniref:Protein AF-10 n=1 Tax=Chrysodeixis includens TaxID=689277 RepID=A0A9P0BLC1_CHRIL|nr:unnamed protein product [Chrysodeixis includens]
MKEMVGGCCVCSDERGWPDNPLVYCDGNGCTVAVHQACYGIVTVPTGPWYCRKCESPDSKSKVRCELCPSKSGALKRSDTGGWAHVVCALYIPEVRFGNVTSMEPIVLRLIPPERYNKSCYICQELGKNHRANAGACMQCNKSGCKQQFHVTCAQGLGLLCEEAGNYLDNVKYCGYCQHHYSKLKKGGNVKTIPPYKPVSHDSQSSDSSCEKEGEASCSNAGGGVTPTHAGKSKGPGRKSSSNAVHGVLGKNTPSTSKPLDKKKPSPSRRGSSAGDGGSGSKSSTPAPSPQHNTDSNSAQMAKASGSSTPAPGPSKATPPPVASPSAIKPVEPVGVISSVAQAVASVSNITTVPTSAPSAPATPAPAPPTSYQESVITNTEFVETKQTKKRKAVSAANSMNTPVDYTSNYHPPSPAAAGEGPSQAGGVWESAHIPADVQLEPVEKVIKKVKTEGPEGIPVPTSHFASVNPAPPLPPPPPAHSPASNPSPRHLPSPMPGPSGMNHVSNIRSPSNPPQVPLPDMPGPSPHIFHQPQKQPQPPPTAMDTGMPPAHSPHVHPGRSWGGLNVAYEHQQQQDPNKQGGVGVMPGSGKDMSAVNIVPMPPAAVRTKKRAAMATSVVAMANAASAIQTAPPPPHSAPSVRRHPQPTPPPIYSETIKDSPPASPNAERSLQPKVESARMSTSCTAPHMLGNELNPESGAAACLQEQLTAELAAHAAGGPGGDALIPPPLINKAAPRHMLYGSGGIVGRSSGAQSLDQLLERQWEQGSQFLMEQAQHFDIASLLSCLHQLRTENVRLEEHVGNLLQRRDHLLAVNARLAIPLTTVTTGPAEASRGPRENGPQMQVRPPPPPVRATETVTSDRPHQLIMREMQQKPS